MYTDEDSRQLLSLDIVRKLAALITILEEMKLAMINIGSQWETSTQCQNNNRYQIMIINYYSNHNRVTLLLFTVFDPSHLHKVQYMKNDYVNLINAALPPNDSKSGDIATECRRCGVIKSQLQSNYIH